MSNYVLCTVLGFSLIVNAYQIYRIDTYKDITNLMDQKDRLQQSGYTELLYSQINSHRDGMMENAKGQGRIEGILSIVNNVKPEENEISSIWHSGYYRGMDQVDYVRTISYEEGYHKACDDMNCPAVGGASQNPKKTMPSKATDSSKPQVEPIKDSNNSKPIIEFKPLPENK
jgi:hypothetical protein